MRYVFVFINVWRDVFAILLTLIQHHMYCSIWLLFRVPYPKGGKRYPVTKPTLSVHRSVRLSACILSQGFIISEAVRGCQYNFLQIMDLICFNRAIHSMAFSNLIVATSSLELSKPRNHTLCVAWEEIHVWFIYI